MTFPRSKFTISRLILAGTAHKTFVKPQKINGNDTPPPYGCTEPGSSPNIPSVKAYHNPECGLLLAGVAVDVVMDFKRAFDEI